MSTYNGFGTSFRGVSRPNTDGVRTGTKWITLLYLPVIPLSRHHFIYGKSKLTDFGSAQEYYILSKEPLDWGEVITTYILCWLVFPLLFVIPGVLIFVYRPSEVGLVIFTVWAVFAAFILIPLLSKLIASPMKDDLRASPSDRKP